MNGSVAMVVFKYQNFIMNSNEVYDIEKKNHISSTASLYQSDPT